MNYPQSWSPLSEPEKVSCPSIAGKYKAASVPNPEYKKTSCEPAVGRGWFCHSLPEDLLGLKAKIKNESWVEIKEHIGLDLEITLGENDTIGQKTVLKSEKDQFECTEDGVVVKVGPEFMVGAGAVGANLGYKYAFRKALDGSLIAKETTSGGGLILFVIPIAGSSVQWWKWQPFDH